MHSLSRFLILAGIFLFSSRAIPAQHFISAAPSANYSYGGFTSYTGYGYSGYGYSDSGWGSGVGSWGYGGLHHPQEHAPFGVGFAHGDPDFQPSEYMDYDQAVALGKKILAEQSAPKPSLADIARSLHLHPRSSSPNPGTTLLLQDSHGKLIVCHTSNTDCRNPA
jgi:hypothetical protein